MIQVKSFIDAQLIPAGLMVTVGRRAAIASTLGGGSSGNPPGGARPKPGKGSGKAEGSTKKQPVFDPNLTSKIAAVPEIAAMAAEMASLFQQPLSGSAPHGGETPSQKMRKAFKTLNFEDFVAQIRQYASNHCMIVTRVYIFGVWGISWKGHTPDILTLKDSSNIQV